MSASLEQLRLPWGPKQELAHDCLALLNLRLTVQVPGLQRDDPKWR